MHTGSLGQGIQQPHAQLIGLTEYIADQLPNWRDHADRPAHSGEVQLTNQLCAFLNGAVHQSITWGHFQFIPETPDENDARRKLDITVQPRTGSIVFAGNRYNIFQAILPIECKRLPTPIGSDRDIREYVYSSYSSSGGIHRFKTGAHGAQHSLVAMIAYVQRDNCEHWHDQVNGWISSLATSDGQHWNVEECLTCSADRKKLNGVLRLHSQHARYIGDPGIAIEHLWVEMVRDIT